MESAKASVKKFMSKDGHHDTTVHEQVSPAVQHETVTAKQHEQATTAVDKEVHQDHYHTSVQPVHQTETLPEQHHHNIKPVEHRSFEHDNNDNVKQRLAEEQGQFRDHSSRVEGERTATAAPTVGGEHVHHHVHETVQPVVQKQTIEPHVVHTTVPVHEVHHNAAQHHAATSLPPVSMDDFKKQDGSLTSREARHEKFDGCPPEHGERIAGHHSQNVGTADTAGRDTLGHNPTTSAHDTSDLGRDGAISSQSNDYKGPLNSHKSDRDGVSGIGNTANTHKPSLMDKLNPKKDADGDGKAGFMK